MRCSGPEVTDDWHDGGTVLHLAADGLGDAAQLARDPGPELVPIADALDLWGVQAVELPAALSLALMAYLIGP